jgi:hypothetical protein
VLKERGGHVQKRERLGMAAGDTDPDLEAFDDEDWQFTVDPPELVEARKRLAEYKATPDKDNAGDHLSNGARSLQLRCMMAR